MDPELRLESKVQGLYQARHPRTRQGSVRPIGAEGLVALLERGLDSVLLIDSRPFVEYNSSHILEAVNVNCSKLMKRRLQQDKVQINELLQHSAKKKLELVGIQEVVVYDQSSSDPLTFLSEAFLTVLLAKLEKSFPSVHLLSGGFTEFSQLFPGLCEGKALLATSCLVPTCLSQPCLPLNTSGPTRILPHLYLGCQRDVLNKEVMQRNEIAYVLNASNTCPKPDYIPESHFLRVPVNDSFCEKILPWFDRSVEFIEKAKASNACVLVHCLAGISRSATIAIAYIMTRMDMSLDEAYRFVKEKRPTISPNFNFLGQLLDFEKKIKTPGRSEIRETVGVKPCPFLLHHPLLDQDPSNPTTPSLPDPALALLEPLTLPCVLAPWPPEERLLAQALQGLQGLQLNQGAEDNAAQLKRSFSLDIKSYREPGGRGGAPVRPYPNPTSHPGAQEYYNPSVSFKEPAGKPCHFSPVKEMSEQSTPEPSPDEERDDGLADPAATSVVPTATPVVSTTTITSSSSSLPGTTTSTTTSNQPSVKQPGQAKPLSCSQQLQRSGSMEESSNPTLNHTPHTTGFLFGLSRSQQHLSKPAPNLGSALKGWHSDILLGPVTVSSGGWYLSESSHRFYSTSAILGSGANILGGGGAAAYSVSQGLEEVRRRGRQRSGDHGDSRRSWHEESTLEKQLKRRSCQMEIGDRMRGGGGGGGGRGGGETSSREEIGSHSSFSGSMEVIQVS
ncbi:LOW QUALITY PROTEIN: dual specificity protein phosphatase 16-like [Salmo salar]|uniref:LOW QUALITY PROTEIN: dual specificity protein phosphatase 16-like n=1 Tax=Salmo salar TaxID=8030 RepID=A0ABM3E8D1_SALSA|nr:LOW QUALITY PROTEIN: dual specificity protein phosphatase 16-like [Salmo salar]